MSTTAEWTQQLEDLRNEIRTVRARIVDLVARMEDIRLQQIPQIQADYALKIGCWEQALLEAELAARRSKRRLALAQAQANQGHAPQMDTIEQQLDAELAEWTIKIEQARESFERQLAYITGSTSMTKEQAAKLKKLYRLLVKRLHPDVCHNKDEYCEMLFQIARVAYRNGDLQTLESLEVATRHYDPAADDLSSFSDMAALAQELELAQIEEGVMRERLVELEQSEEMRLAKLLADPDWVTKRTMELRLAVEKWEQVRTECDERLRVMKEAFNEHRD